MQQEKLEFFASCLAGLEAPLADELKALGIRSVRPLGGGVAFFCDVRHALAACLWSRLASRIMLVVGRVDARLADLLFEDALELPWEDVIAPGASIAVSAHGMNDELRNAALHRAQGEGRRVRPPARGAGGAPERGRRASQRGHRRARAREARHHLARPVGRLALPPHLPRARRRCRGAARVRARRRPAGACRLGRAGARGSPASTRPAATAPWWWRRHPQPATWRRGSRAIAGASTAGRASTRTHGPTCWTMPMRASSAGWRPPRRRGPWTARHRRAPTSASCASRACPRPRRPSRGRAGAPSAQGSVRP